MTQIRRGFSRSGDPAVGRVDSGAVSTTALVGGLFTKKAPRIHPGFRKDARIVVAEGDTGQMLKGLPDGTFKLVITSPPYNLGKEYELETELDEYLAKLNPIVDSATTLPASTWMITVQSR